MALFAQIASNFANDYFDFKKGADREDRLGPERAVAQGWITPKAMLKATFLTLGLSCFCGESPAADICCRRAGSESAEFPSVELSVWGIRALKV